MPYTARTIRRMTPTARKLAALHNDAARLATALKRLVDRAHDLDLDAAHHCAATGAFDLLTDIARFDLDDEELTNEGEHDLFIGVQTEAQRILGQEPTRKEGKGTP